MYNVVPPSAELFSHIRPGNLADELNIEAFRFGKSKIGRNKQACGVYKRNEAGRDSFRHRSSSAAVTTDRAISAILLFSFIAVFLSRRYASSSLRLLAFI